MSPKTSTKIREYAESLCIAFILAMVIRCFVLEAFKIPTGSMEPTLRGDPSLGDRILVSKLYYDVHDPQRWDIFVFYVPDTANPDTPDTHYIKRLAGKPGETIKIYNGNLYVNGKLEHKPEKIQSTIWRKVADEQILASAEMLHRLNTARSELMRSNSRVNIGTWADIARAIEFEEQMRLLEKDARYDEIWEKSLQNAESALSSPSSWHTGEFWQDLPNRPDFKRWFAYWNALRLQALQKVEVLNEDYAKNGGILLKNGIEKAWNTRGFNVEPNGKLVASHDAAKAEYRHKISDGRFNDHVEFITDDRMAWANRLIGTGENTVGDIKLEFDLTLPANGSSATVQTQGNGIEYQVKFSTVADGKRAVELLKNGAAVKTASLPSAENYHVVLKNADGIYSVTVDGQQAVSDDYSSYIPPENAPSSIQLLASRDVAYDNINVWRDVYYTKMGPRAIPGKAEWGRDGTYKLAEGEYLALGDNSPNSRDSRDWGPVPEQNIVGEAFFILTPFHRLGFLK